MEAVFFVVVASFLLAHADLLLGRVTAKAVGLVGGALQGFAVSKLRVPAFIVTLGGLSIFRGLALTMTSGQPMSGLGLELQVISACVLGGVSLTGGVGTMGGVIVGVLIMGVVQNVMSLLNIPPFYQYLVSYFRGCQWSKCTRCS